MKDVRAVMRRYYFGGICLMNFKVGGRERFRSKGRAEPQLLTGSVPRSSREEERAKVGGAWVKEQVVTKL